MATHPPADKAGKHGGLGGGCPLRDVAQMIMTGEVAVSCFKLIAAKHACAQSLVQHLPALIQCNTFVACTWAARCPHWSMIGPKPGWSHSKRSLRKQLQRAAVGSPMQGCQ